MTLSYQILYLFHDLYSVQVFILLLQKKRFYQFEFIWFLFQKVKLGISSAFLSQGEWGGVTISNLRTRQPHRWGCRQSSRSWWCRSRSASRRCRRPPDWQWPWRPSYSPSNSTSRGGRAATAASWSEAPPGQNQTPTKLVSSCFNGWRLIMERASIEFELTWVLF